MSKFAATKKRPECQSSFIKPDKKTKKKTFMMDHLKVLQSNIYGEISQLSLTDTDQEEVIELDTPIQMAVKLDKTTKIYEQKDLCSPDWPSLKPKKGRSGAPTTSNETGGNKKRTETAETGPDMPIQWPSLGQQKGRSGAPTTSNETTGAKAKIKHHKTTKIRTDTEETAETAETGPDMPIQSENSQFVSNMEDMAREAEFFCRYLAQRLKSLQIKEYRRVVNKIQLLIIDI